MAQWFAHLGRLAKCQRLRGELATHTDAEVVVLVGGHRQLVTRTQPFGAEIGELRAVAAQHRGVACRTACHAEIQRPVVGNAECVAVRRLPRRDIDGDGRAFGVVPENVERLAERQAVRSVQPDDVGLGCFGGLACEQQRLDRGALARSVQAGENGQRPQRKIAGRETLQIANAK